MGKRQTGPSSTKVYKHPHKTKKRLAIKKALLKKQSDKKSKGRSK